MALKKYFRLWNKVKKFSILNKINNEFNSKLFENYIENNINQDFICPISKELFKEPVVLGCYFDPDIGGNTYEKELILRWLEEGNLTDPLTNVKIINPVLIKNNIVIKEIKSFKEEYKLKLDKEGVKPCYFKN